MARTKKSSESTPTSYVAYYRVSTVSQGQSGLGLDAQRHAVAHLAKHGPIISEYTEVESGKRHDNRPQLLAALAECKKRQATLLIAKLDRLARNVHFISGLMESGIDFVAADMPQANRLTVHIIAAMAEYEREQISQRTLHGLASAQREIESNGFRISRRSGKAYSKHGNPNWQGPLALANKAKRKPAQRAADAVAILKSHREQGKSLRVIAAAANALGLKTASGAQWHASSVRAALIESERPKLAA